VIDFNLAKHIEQSDYPHAASFKMYYVGFRASKSPPVKNTIRWFSCVQVSLVLTHNRPAKPFGNRKKVENFFSSV